MTPELFAALLSDAGRAALEDAAALQPGPTDFLPAFRRLSKKHDPDLARAALDTVLLRQRAAAKFDHAERMFFTREALEQATAQPVAEHRAARFAGLSSVADLCCGIGGDAAALAGVVPRVVAVDLDPVRLLMAAANLDAVGRRNLVEFRQCDALDLTFDDADGAFCDPDRRSDGRRHVSIKAYRPMPADVVARWAGRPLAIKLAPAVDWNELAAFDAGVDFVSLRGELKECVLWFGPLQGRARRATVLPGPHTLEADRPAESPGLSEPLAMLYDPDPAVTRAGLVTDLSHSLGAFQIDPQIAFLTSAELRPTPFARAYHVEAAMPFHVARLTEFLRARGVGRVTVVRRGSPADPATLPKQLKLKGDAARTLVLTRVNGTHSVIVASGQDVQGIQASGDRDFRG